MPTRDWPFFQTTAYPAAIFQPRPVRERGQSLLCLCLRLGLLLLDHLRVEGFGFLLQNCALRPSGIGECIRELRRGERDSGEYDGELCDRVSTA